jgi:aspartyl protease family protein
MALSSGAKRALGMAAAWLAVAVVVGVVHVRSGEIARFARRVALTQRGAEAAAPQTTLPRQLPHGGRVVEIRAGLRGHYVASAEINGRAVDVLIDSGASLVALSFDDAQRAGIYVHDGDFTERAHTANGVARVAPVTLDRISIGDVSVSNVAATVSEPGSLSTSLLGMSFLSRLQRVDMRPGVLILVE